MKRKSYQVIISFLVLLLSVGTSLSVLDTSSSVQAATSSKISVPQTTISATAGLAIAADSGQILAAKDIDQALPIASLTKMVSLYLVLQAVKSGKLSWTQEITPTADVIKLSQNMELSNIPLESGKAYTVKELYEASWIYSANAAVMALADAVSGSQSAFIDAMKAQLQKWGAKDYTIINVSGMNNSYLSTDQRYAGSAADDENQMRARDLAVVAQHLLNEFPEILQVTSQSSIDFHGTVYPSWDLALPGQSGASKEITIDGLKTGTSDKAGQCFVSTAKKNGFRIITVILHADGNDADNLKRFTATTSLMSGIFSNWHSVTIMQAKTKSSALKPVTVKDGKEATVAVVPATTVKMLLPNSIKASQLKLTVAAKNNLSAPITKGEKVASVTLPEVGEGYLTAGKTKTIILIATKSVAKLNWLQRLWRNFINLFH